MIFGGTEEILDETELSYDASTLLLHQTVTPINACICMRIYPETSKTTTSTPIKKWSMISRRNCREVALKRVADVSTFLGLMNCYAFRDADPEAW